MNLLEVDYATQQHWHTEWQRPLSVKFAMCSVFNRLTPTAAISGTAIKHPVADRVNPSFVIFDIRALWRSGLNVRVPGCQNYKRRLNPVWHRMLYSCTRYGSSERQRVKPVTACDWLVRWESGKWRKLRQVLSLVKRQIPTLYVPWLRRKWVSSVC